VTVRVAGARGAATLERLQAPSAYATQGVTFAGQSFGLSTNTGLLYGQRNMVVLPAAAGAYVVRSPAASATLVTLR
jgi:glycosyl hydrolase family 79